MSGAAWTESEMDLRERVIAELVACYGEGEDTDWPYLNDLRDVIVGMIETEAATGRQAVRLLMRARYAVATHAQTDGCHACTSLLNEIDETVHQAIEHRLEAGGRECPICHGPCMEDDDA